MTTRRTFAQQGDLLKLSGDTFSIKEELKRMGARFDGRQKCWFISDAKETAQKLEFLGFLPSTLKTDTGLLSSTETQTGSAVSPVTQEETWSVSQLTLFVERLFQQHLNFDFWIIGEVSSLKSSSGHIFFDLTEPLSDENRALAAGKAVSVSCCLWAGKARLLTEKLREFPLAEGIKVKLKVNCDFRKEGSRISLIINDIDPQFTLGDLAHKRAQIVRELKRRGLYDRQKTSTRWPDFPLRLALITAAGSKAHTDFLNELVLSQLAFRVTLFDCLMQGERVQESVTAALKLIENSHENSFDCIVITRGGGSRLDLRWFDDLEICKAIAYASKPVMTAIGHFEDVSIADEVSSVAEKTPTGAARYLVNRVAQGFERSLSQMERAALFVQQRISRERQNLGRLEVRLEQAPRLRLDREKEKLQTTLRALRLVQNTAARPLQMGYSVLRSMPNSEPREGRPLTADDFLTSAPPHRVEVQLWSRQKNAQVLLEVNVISIRHHPLSPDAIESMLGADIQNNPSTQDTYGKPEKRDV